MATYEEKIKCIGNCPKDQDDKTLHRPACFTGTWRVRYRDPGDANPKSIGPLPNEKAARALAGKIDEWQLFHEGLPFPRERTHRIHASLMDGAAAWLEDLMREGKADKTVREYSYKVEAFARFMNAADPDQVKVTALTAENLKAWDLEASKTLRSNGKPMGNGGRRARLVAVQLLWAWLAGEGGGIAKWPGIGAPVRVKPPAYRSPRVKAPTWAESDASLYYCEPGSPEYRAVWLARCLGLRVDQVRSILWAHVDLDKESLFVPSGKTQVEKRGRTVPVAPVLVAEMRTWTRAEGPIVALGYLPLLARVTAAWQAATDAKLARAEVWAASEITGRVIGCPNHAYRHGFTSGLKRLGADVEAAELLVAHVDGKAAAGSRGAYLDEDALPLREAVALIPPYVAPKAPPLSLVAQTA